MLLLTTDVIEQLKSIHKRPVDELRPCVRVMGRPVKKRMLGIRDKPALRCMGTFFVIIIWPVITLYISKILDTSKGTKKPTIAPLPTTSPIYAHDER